MSTTMSQYFAFESPPFSSSGRATPELMSGAQGWSPYSSVLYSDDDDEEGNDENIDTAASVKRRSSDFPLPPTRDLAIKPSVVRATSAMDLAAIRKMQAWTFEVFAEEVNGSTGESNAIGDTGSSLRMRKRMSVDRPTYIEMPPSSRRVSTNIPRKMEEEIDAGDDAEPDEYPFPYMISNAKTDMQRSFSQQAEDEKLQRLQASLSLLSVDGENDNGREDNYSRRLDILSPEQGAPSLAEQMAYACGLGNAYSWSSPAPLDFASPAGLFNPTALLDATTFAQEERKMASRHVRQVVASNGAAPMPRKVSMQTATLGEMAEVGSNWSHSHKDFDDEDAEIGQLDCVRPESPLEYDLEDRKDASEESSAGSSVGSPILNGALSADDFYQSSASSGSSEIDTPLTCATSVYSEESRQFSKNGATIDSFFTQGLKGRQMGSPRKVVNPPQSASPVSLHEFSYILECGELDQGTSTNCQSDKNSFNGCTFSPALESPEVEKLPPMLFSSEPSPTLERASIEPYYNVNSSYGMSRSISSGSVLERPRPISRLESSGFFGGMDLEIVHQMVSSASMSSIKRISESPRPKSVASSTVQSQSTHSRTNSDAVSIRKSAMSQSRSMSAFGNRSDSDKVSLFSTASSAHSRLERLLAELPKKTVSFASTQSEHVISSRSSFSEIPIRLSSRGMAQVKEACRAKEDHSRNIEMDRFYAQEEKLKAAIAQREKMNSPAKKKSKLFTISKSHASESALSHLDKPLPLIKKKSSMLSLRKEATSESNAQPRNVHQRHRSCTVTIPDTARVNLPIVLVARTNSQRKRGYTGVPETEPAALALAKMGIRTNGPTRSSKVEAITRSSVPLDKGELVNMPNGVILIVEEKHIVTSRTLA